MTILPKMTSASKSGDPRWKAVYTNTISLDLFLDDELMTQIWTWKYSSIIPEIYNVDTVLRIHA